MEEAARLYYLCQHCRLLINEVPSVACAAVGAEGETGNARCSVEKQRLFV